MGQPVAVLHHYDFGAFRSNVGLRIDIDNIASRDVKARNDRSPLLGLETQKSACAADIEEGFTCERCVCNVIIEPAPQIPAAEMVDGPEFGQVHHVIKPTLIGTR